MSEVTLFCGDCLEVLPTLLDYSADAIITDLPYGTTACSWDEIIPFEPMWEQVKRLCKGAFVTTASQPFTSKLVMSQLNMFRYEWVWDKVNMFTNQVNADKMPMRQHENICVFSANGHAYNPQKRKGKPYVGRGGLGKAVEVDGLKRRQSGNLSGLMYPGTVLDLPANKPENHGLHPTQKPVALYEYLIRTYTNEGDTVLDFCMGSGTTGVAAVHTGRNFIGVEKREDYFKIAEKRIKEAQAQMVMEFK